MLLAEHVVALRKIKRFTVGAEATHHSVLTLTLGNFLLKLLLHLVEETHDVLEIRLDFLFQASVQIAPRALLSVVLHVVSLALRRLLQLVTLVEAVDVLEGLAQRRWHLLV